MFVNNWKNFFCDKYNIVVLIVTTIAFTIITIAYTEFLQYNEIREGYLFYDPLLNALPIYDLTFVIFITLYTMSILYGISVLNKPEKVIIFFQVYGILIIIRIISMYLIPLEPPNGIITLIDPFAESFLEGNVLKKDLFFSGHTMTIFTFYFLTQNKILKKLFLTSSIIIAVSLLIQHVHYSIDVIGAIIAAYISVMMQKTLCPFINHRHKV